MVIQPPVKQPRQVGAPVAKHGRAQEKAFAASTASLTGESVRSIQRHLARAEALGDDLDRIFGTSLDKGVELDALIKLPEQARKDLIERAQSGEKISAVKILAHEESEFFEVKLKAKTLQALHRKLQAALAIVESHLANEVEALQ
jgi:hypothetical protein